MLATSATANTTDAHSRVNPSLRLSAVAHTASRAPEMMRTVHATARLLTRRLVALRVRHLVREPGVGSELEHRTPARGWQAGRERRLGSALTTLGGPHDTVP